MTTHQIVIAQKEMAVCGIRLAFDVGFKLAELIALGAGGIVEADHGIPSPARA